MLALAQPNAVQRDDVEGKNHLIVDNDARSFRNLTVHLDDERRFCDLRVLLDAGRPAGDAQEASVRQSARHSHSIVAGGFVEIS